jgi:hypothetical protein
MPRLRPLRGKRLAAVVAAIVIAAMTSIGGAAAFLNHKGNSVPCTGCQLPRPVLVAKVSIPKGTSGRVIGTKALYSTKYVRWSPMVKGALVDPSEARGEVTTRNIPAGAQLTADDFALRGPIHYPRGYPKSVSASRTPAKMSDYLGPPSFASDLAVAPGVWVDGSPSEAATDEHVANGTLVGYCRPVRTFQAHNPEIPFATKCW